MNRYAALGRFNVPSLDSFSAESKPLTLPFVNTNACFPARPQLRRRAGASDNAAGVRTCMRSC